MEPHRVRQETAYPSLAYGLFGLGRFLPQIPDSYKRVIFMSICGSIRLSLDKQRWHRAWRARQRPELNAAVRITEAKDVEEAFDDFNLILPREVSNIWTMEKEGKVRFSPVKYRNEEWWKSVMSK